MAIVYRSVKGSALTSNEVDNNFEELYDATQLSALDVEVVHIAGTETITGSKTLQADTKFDSDVYFLDATYKKALEVGVSNDLRIGTGFETVNIIPTVGGGIGTTLSYINFNNGSSTTNWVGNIMNITQSGGGGINIGAVDPIGITSVGRVSIISPDIRFYDGVDGEVSFVLTPLTTTRVVTFQDKDITIAGTASETFTGTTTFLSTIDVTTSITTPSTTFALVNTTATTVNFAGAATTLNIGVAGGVTTVLGGVVIKSITDIYGGAGMSLIIGSDAASNTTRTNATQKVARFGVPHYTNSEEPIATLNASAESSANRLIFGGGSAAMNSATNIAFHTAANNTTVTGTERLSISSTAITIADAMNLVVGSSTGIIYGTATSQKQGWWNAAPIVQPTTAIAASTFVANTSGIVNDTATWDGYTMGQVVKALRNMGKLA
jgi:hypothetical protein